MATLKYGVVLNSVHSYIICFICSYLARTLAIDLYTMWLKACMTVFWVPDLKKGTWYHSD